MLGTYKKSNKKILMYHALCGTNYYVTPNDFLSGCRCPNCYGTPKKNTKQFKNEVFSIVGNEYDVLGEYISTNDKILMRHNVCGHIWNPKVTNFLNNGTRCPKCSKKVSKMEKYILELLNKIKNSTLNFDFAYHYKFDDCKYIYLLEWDFYIFNCSNHALIEIDGRQHEEPVRFGGITLFEAQENFKKTQIRDNIKEQYKSKKNIPLLRIKHNDKDYINTLLNFLVDQGFLNVYKKTFLLSSKIL